MELRKYSLPCVWKGARLLRYEVRVGQELSINQTILVLSVPTGTKVVTYKGDEGSFVSELPLQPNEAVKANTILMLYTYCPHDIVYYGLCATCYKKPKVKRMVKVLPSTPKLLVSAAKAEQIASRRKRRLHDNKRLSLVLDLDHTLLHAQDLSLGTSRVPKPLCTHSHIMKQTIMVAWRPHLQQFLEEASKLYELHIYTHGRRSYAEAIANELDPKNIYFAPQGDVGQRRITSLDDDKDNQETKRQKVTYTKRIDRLFPGDDRQVLVLDDSNVWGASPNVIRVKKFRAWNPHGTKAISAAAKDDHLLNMLSLLHKCHSLYYRQPEGDVKTCLAALKQRLFRGYSLFLSGMDRHISTYTAIVKQYGATVLLTNPTHTDDEKTLIIIGDESQLFQAGIHIRWIIDCIRECKLLDLTPYKKNKHNSHTRDYYAIEMAERVL